MEEQIDVQDNIKWFLRQTPKYQQALRDFAEVINELDEEKFQELTNLFDEQ